MDQTPKEPVATAGAIQILIGAVIGLTAAFGVWEPSPAQIGAITAAYVAFVLVLTTVTRKKVTPV